MPGCEWHPAVANCKIEHVGEVDTYPSEVAALSISIGDATVRLLHLAGLDGGGKTEWPVRMFHGRKMVLFTPENSLADSLCNNQRLGLESSQVQTIHHYHCTDCTKHIQDWDLTALGYRLDSLAEIILFEESCNILTKILKINLAYIANRTFQIKVLGIADRSLCGRQGRPT